jgi:hypothetical protein
MVKRKGDPMAKKRGGQLNNTNACKHGFYSKHFTEFENQALSEIPLADVTDMIANLRVTTARFMEAYSTSLDELDYESRLAGLRAISLAAGCIAGLVRLQAFAEKKAKKEYAPIIYLPTYFAARPESPDQDRE